MPRCRPRSLTRQRPVSNVFADNTAAGPAAPQAPHVDRQQRRLGGEDRRLRLLQAADQLPARGGVVHGEDRTGTAPSTTPIDPVDRAEARKRYGSAADRHAGTYFIDCSRTPVYTAVPSAVATATASRASHSDGARSGQVGSTTETIATTAPSTMKDRRMEKPRAIQDVRGLNAALQKRHQFLPEVEHEERGTKSRHERPPQDTQRRPFPSRTAHGSDIRRGELQTQPAGDCGHDERSRPEAAEVQVAGDEELPGLLRLVHSGAVLTTRASELRGTSAHGDPAAVARGASVSNGDSLDGGGRPARQPVWRPPHPDRWADGCAGRAARFRTSPSSRRSPRAAARTSSSTLTVRPRPALTATAKASVLDPAAGRSRETLATCRPRRRSPTRCPARHPSMPRPLRSASTAPPAGTSVPLMGATCSNVLRPPRAAAGIRASR